MRDPKKIMTTSDYVQKYSLSSNDKFNHASFVNDLKKDFNKLLTSDIRKNGKITEHRFNNNIRFIRMKFNAINNKTTGVIPESLFGYFFAEVVIKKKNSFFK